MNSLRSVLKETAAPAKAFSCRKKVVSRRRYLVLEAARRPLVAGLVLTSFVTTQCIFPLAHAWAQANSSGRQPVPVAPAPKVRLAQRAAGEEKEIGAPGASARLGRRNEKISLRKLDISRPPSEKELREAGGMGGAMSPLGNADVQLFQAELDQNLKRSGFPRGLNEQAPATSAPGRVLAQAKVRVERLEAINWSFGRALDQRVKRNFDRTRELMKQHVEEFPDSPWAGEALLHLAMDAYSHEQPGEAQTYYQKLIEGTEVDPAQPGLDADNPKHGSYEVRQKAKAGWAYLDISLGQWQGADEKLKNIVDTEVDWRRRTWAQAWQMRVALMRSQKQNLQACGTAALGSVLVSLGREQAAEQVRKMMPPRNEGFSMAELARISKKHGVEARGFQATPARLATMKLPVIIHYDMSRITARQLITQATKSPGVATKAAAAPAVPLCEHCPPPSATQAGQSAVAGTTAMICLPKPQQNAVRATASPSPSSWLRGVPAVNTKAKPKKASPFRPAAINHFLVVEKVDQKSQRIQLFDPLENKRYGLSLGELKQGWSGYGLAFSPQAAPAQRTAWLSDGQMARIFGGCCCGAMSPGNSGPGPENMGPGESPCGSPVWSVNAVSMNMYVQDVPLWYSTPVGPDVSIGMHYNTQTPTNYNQAFGNRWQFGYSSHLIENPDGTIIALLPDSRQMAYYPKETGGYRSPVELPSTLQKLSANRFQITFPAGDSLIYDLPNGDPLLIGAGPVLAEVRDNRGFALTFTYDNDGRMSKITDAQSKETLLFYEDTNFPTSITRIKDPFGRQARFQYDVNGNLVQVWDMEGAGANYTYNNQIWMTQIETARGEWNFAHLMNYNGVQLAERSVTITDPSNATEQFYWRGDHTYDHRYVTYTDKRGKKTLYAAAQTVGNSGKITTIIAPDNSQTMIAYDPWTAQPATVTDAKGRITRMTYNALGKPTSVTDPKGRTTRMLYAANGLDLLEVVNSRNQKVMSATYNAYHQPESVTQDPNDIDGLQATSLMSYTAWGMPATATDAVGNETTFTYDGTSKLLTSVAREGSTLGTFTYDRMSRIRTVTDALSLTATYDYNDLNRLERVTYSDGTYNEQDSSCCGTSGAVRDRAGRLSYTDYDAMKRPVRMQDASGNVVSLEYDAEGSLTHIIDAKGNVTNFIYDGLGRLVRKAYPNHATESFAYDTVGNLLASRDAQGRLTRYFYDSVTDDLVKVDNPLSPDITFTYDDLGRIATMTDGLGTSTYAYDLLGRTTSLNGPFAADTLSFVYDDMGRRQSYSLNGVLQATYAFDNQGRLDSLTGVAGVFDYSYVGSTGLPSQITNPNGTKAVYSYDALARLEQVSNKTSANANLSTFAYGFDPALDPQRGVRTSLDKTIGANPTQRASYGYDTVDQLTSEVLSIGGTPQWSKSFTYDAMGNRTTAGSVTPSDTTSSSYTSNKLNQVTALNASWGGGANTLASTLLYDNSGNLKQWSSTGTGAATSSHTEYIYDDSDRLVAVVKKNPSTSANESKSEFVYDGLSRLRISKEFTWSGSAWEVAPDSEKRRVYDGMDVIQERDDANAVTATYTRDGNIGGILSKRDGNGDDYFFHYDGSGNVIQLTDDSQDSVAEYAYDAYGNLLSSSGAQASKNAYRYSTKEYFAHAGLYNYGLRFYSSGLGRWINRDPIAEAGGLNLYGFVANNPVNLGDAYGLSFKTFMQGFATGFVVGGIASIAITAAIAATGGVGAAVILGITLGIGAYGLMQTINQLMSSNLCPDERDRIIGELLGGLLGGMLTGPLGARAGEAARLGIRGVGAKGVDMGLGPYAPGGVPDSFTLVKGGTKPPPPAGEVFSVSYGQTVAEAGAGVPHGQVQVTTAGQVRANGGMVEVMPENTGTIMNMQHANVTLKSTNSIFSAPVPNPVPKAGRIGGAGYGK